MSSSRVLFALLGLLGLAIALSLEPARLNLTQLKTDWLNSRRAVLQKEAECEALKQWHQLLQGLGPAQPALKIPLPKLREDQLATLQDILNNSDTFKSLKQQWEVAPVSAATTADELERLQIIEQQRLEQVERILAAQVSRGRDLVNLGPGLQLSPMTPGLWNDSHQLRLLFGATLLLMASLVLCFVLYHRALRRRYQQLGVSGRRCVLLILLVVLVGGPGVLLICGASLWGQDHSLIQLDSTRLANFRLASYLRREIQLANHRVTDLDAQIRQKEAETLELTGRALTPLEALKRTQEAALKNLRQQALTQFTAAQLQALAQDALTQLQHNEAVATTVLNLGPPATSLLPGILLGVGLLLPFLVLMLRPSRHLRIGLLGVPQSGKTLWLCQATGTILEGRSPGFQRATRLPQREDFENTLRLVQAGNTQIPVRKFEAHSLAPPDRWQHSETASLPERRILIDLFDHHGDVMSFTGASSNRQRSFQMEALILFLDPTQPATWQRDRFFAWHSALCESLRQNPGSTTVRPVAVCISHLDQLADATIFGPAADSWLEILRQTQTLPTWKERVQARSRLVQQALPLLMPHWDDLVPLLERSFGVGNVLFVPLLILNEQQQTTIWLDPVKWLLHRQGFRVE